MKVLLIGGGAREHALAVALHQSLRYRRETGTSLAPAEAVLPGSAPQMDGSEAALELWAAPGNPGIASLARCVPIAADDVEGLVALAVQQAFALVVVGPEAPLAAGLVDRLTGHGIPAFGPTAKAAELESSKAFSKQLMARYGIPTAAFGVFTDQHEALAWVAACPLPTVVKADGLAAGKGVVIAHTRAEAREAVLQLMDPAQFGAAGSRLVIETFLQGEEASFLAICDGHRALPLVSSQDHKQAFDGDQGPNTGGMGVISPTPLIDEALHHKIQREVIEPTLAAMRAEGRPFVGVLYAGLMIHEGQVQVLEFNARFGDPETEAIMSRLDDDLLGLLLDAARGTLPDRAIRFKSEPSCTVVMAARGYPGSYRKGMEIQGVEDASALSDVQVYHAGTALKDGKLVTQGGRVLAVTALGSTLDGAIARAYEACRLISWEELHYRTDIGHRARRHSPRSA